MLTVMTSGGGSTLIDESEVRELGPVLVAGDPGYDDARVIFNGMFNHRPAAIARCRGAADVIAAVRFARRHELLVAVRAGGHNVAGTSMCDGGLVIDVSPMKGVWVDLDRRIARVQSGATWADVDRETQAFGLAAPGGVVSHTGVAGLTLSGGIGWLRNRYGLSCDNVVAAQVVTAGGDLVTASATENEDLFWALRGGGGNFGVVTSFDFQLHPVGPMVAAVFSFYPMAIAREVLRAWRKWTAVCPDDVSSEVLLWTVPAAGLPPAVCGRDVVIAGGVHAGNPEAGMRSLQPLREFGEPLAEIAGAMPFRNLQMAFDGVFPNTGELISHWKSLYLQDLTDDGVEVMVDRGEHRSSPQTMIFVQHLGGAIQRVRSTDTAFASRDARFIVNFSGTWRERCENERHVAWVREAWNRLAPASTGAVYLNYLGAEGRAESALVRNAFGSNYDRLVTVKTKYDPTNLFRLNPNIAPGG